MQINYINIISTADKFNNLTGAVGWEEKIIK